MTNQEISKIFVEIGNFLEIKEESFKSQAYRHSARVVGFLDKELGLIYQEGGIKSIIALPTIGQGIAEKIIELLKTGKLEYYQKLKKELPVDMEGLTAIEGVGPKMVKQFYQELKIKNLDDLEKAAKAGKIQKLPGFKKKTEENILQGIEFLKKSGNRLLLGVALPLANSIVEKLEGLKEVKKVVVAGSIRRREETIGDIDLLVVSPQPKKVMDFFCSLPEVIHIYGKGTTKASVRFKIGIDVDLKVIKGECFGSSWQYFTGSKEHNVATRILARKKNLKLNEYGVFKNKKRIAGRTEKGVYKVIGLPYIEPEIRTNKGEIEAAKNNKLSQLLDYNDIKGDLHVHTTWSEGIHSIEEMAVAAKKMGYKYLAITDHAQYLKMANGMDEKRLLKQIREIDKINKRIKGIKILKGAEVNILKDGSLDIEDKVLSKLDIVLVGVHSHFKMTKDEMTKRVIKALDNKYVNIFVHPTGRILQKREPYQIDLDEIFKVAKKNKVALEVSASYFRLDLKDSDIKKAIQNGVKLVINTDTHQKKCFSMMEFGVAQARRGWAEKNDIINTRSLSSLLKFLKK